MAIKSMLLTCFLTLCCSTMFATALKVQAWLVEANAGCYKIHVVLTLDDGTFVTSGGVWLPPGCAPASPNKLVYEDQAVVADNGHTQAFIDLIKAPEHYGNYLTARNIAMGHAKTTMGTSELQKIKGVDFDIYPNPQSAGKDFSLQLKFDPNTVAMPLSVNIYDALGKLVEAHPVTKAAIRNTAIRIQTKTLPAGIYNVGILSNGECIGNRGLIIQ